MIRRTLAAVLALTAAAAFAADVKRTENTTTDTRAGAYWGLSAAETSRYTELTTRGMLRHYADNLSPPEVLGIYARSEAERARMAELIVRAEFDYVERLLALERAKAAAWARLYPNVPALTDAPR